MSLVCIADFAVRFLNFSFKGIGKAKCPNKFPQKPVVFSLTILYYTLKHMNNNLCTFLIMLSTYGYFKLSCFDAVLCESNCVCHLLGTLIQCKSTRHTVELCLRDENFFLKFLSNQRNTTRAFMLHHTAFCSVYAYR